MRTHWLIPQAGSTGTPPIGSALIESAMIGSFAMVQVAYATQYMTIEQAQRQAFAQASEFRSAAPPDSATAAALGAASGWTPRIFQARATDQHLGWLIVDQVIGKSELITYALALDAAGQVISIEVLDYRESHGAEIRLPAWRKQFIGKAASDAPTLDKDIRNISGATLSCRHITQGVQRLLKLYDSTLKSAG